MFNFTQDLVQTEWEFSFRMSDHYALWVELEAEALRPRNLRAGVACDDVCVDALVRIAPGALEDVPAIAGIYHHYVRTSHATFEVDPRTEETWRAWFDGFGGRGRHRLLVAREDGRVVGYASSSAYRPRAAYDPSVETSVYLDESATKRGIGTALLAALLAELETEDVHRAYAGIAQPNPASIRLHERFGYRHVGTFSEQGRKFGRYWDVAWYERRFPNRRDEEDA